MKKLVTLHITAAVITTVAYRAMTGGDGTYIMAMMCLYLWVLVAIWVVQVRWKERKHSLNVKNAPQPTKAMRDKTKITQP